MTVGSDALRSNDLVAMAEGRRSELRLYIDSLSPLRAVR